MTLGINDYRFGLIQDAATREVLQEMAHYVGTIGASHLTSVGLSAPASVFTVSGSPITSKGTLALAFNLQAANTLLRGPTSGGSAAPSFGNLVPADFGSQSANLYLASPDGASGNPTWRAPVLADYGSQVKNTFPAGPTTGVNAAPTWRVLDKADLPAEAARTDQANGLTGNQTLSTGDFIAATVGHGLKVKEGTNARMGVATLVAGTVTVSNTSVTANTRVFYAVQAPGGTQGFLSASVVASTSFTLTSTSATDTSTVAWLLVEPA